MYVVVIFGDKRKHSDVVGPYSTADQAETVVRMLIERDGFDTIAFPVQTVQTYTAWLRGDR